MKRIIKTVLCFIVAALVFFLTEAVVLADGATTTVYTVTEKDGGYAIVSGGVSIAEADELSELIDAAVGAGEYELYFDTVSTKSDLTLYRGNVTFSGVITFLNEAALTVDGAHLRIGGGAVAFEGGTLRVKRGALTVSGGSVSSSAVAVLSDFSASSVINIKGGSISSDTTHAIVTERGSVNISGGAVRGADSAILAYTSVTLSGSPTLSGREYDLITDTEPTLFSDFGIYRGAVRIKLLSSFPEGRATVALYAKSPESLVGITLFDVDGICHPLHFLDKDESGVGESVGAVLRPYTVTFYHGDDVLAKSEYIKGWSIEIPDAPSIVGYNFTGWRTDDGELYDFNTELHSDVSLFAAYTLTPPTYTLISPTFTYDGMTRYVEIRELYHPLLSEGFVSYEWYKDGTPLNSFGESHSVKCVADSGEYSVKITFTVGKSSVSVTTPVADVKITKKAVALPEIPAAKYTGLPISASISDTAEYSVASVSGTPVGAYPVAITLKDSENYCFEGSESATVYVDFVIEKAINEWTQPLSIADIYEGETLDMSASALFGRVEILFRKANDTQQTSEVPTEAGEYIARAFVAGTENYTSLDGEAVSFRIIAEHVVGISVIKRPNKEVYSAFEHISYEGIEVLAMYNSKRLEEVDPSRLVFIYQSADSFRYGDSGITVSFGGVNVTLPLTVEKAEYDLSGVSFPAVACVYRGSLITVPVPQNLPIGLDGIPLVGTVRGGGTAVGEYRISLEFSSESRNYRLPPALSTSLTVTPYAVSAVWCDTEFVYDSTEKLPTAFYLDVFGRRVTVEVKGARSLAGEYVATLVCTDDNYVISNPTAQFVIKKADYDVSGIKWCGGGEVYDGYEKSVYLTSLPDGISVVGYVNNRAVESGSYTARASLSFDAENYNPPPVPEFCWQILKREYETDGFRFADAEYIYDKLPHYPTLVGDMPVGIDGVRLEYEFSHGVINVREGRAAVNVIFKTKSKNYEPPKNAVAYVTVLPKDINVSWGELSAVYSGAYILPEASCPECSITVIGGGSSAGEYELKATADDPNYNVVNKSAVLIIHRAENKWIVFPTVKDVFYGKAPSPRAEARAGAVTYTYYSVLDKDTPIHGVPRAVGEYTVTAHSDGDENHLPITSEPILFKIIAVVPISFDVTLGKTEFTAFDVLGENTSASLSYNDGSRVSVPLDEIEIEYPRAEHFLFGDSEVKLSYYGYTVILPITVVRADYDVSGVRWEMTEAVYDGSFKCPYISGLPEGITVVEYIGGGVGAGEYTVSAVLSYDTENYNPPTLPSVTLRVAKKRIPTPIIAPVEYNGKTVVLSELDTELYSATVVEGQYPGSYPVVFTVIDGENYEFECGGAVTVDFVIERRKLTVRINSVELGLFERAPDFTFEITEGSLLPTDRIIPIYTVRDGKIYADVNMPNYDVTVIEGEYIKTYRMSVGTAIFLLCILLILVILTVLTVLLIRRWKGVIRAREVLVSIGKSLDVKISNKTENTEEKQEQKCESDNIKISDPISSEYANEMISNSLAKDLIRREVTIVTDGWRKGIVNVDTLSESFCAGDHVDVNVLKKKSLIPYDTAYIKVLARGVIDKPLRVYANDFSLSAVKMIALSGGKAIKVTTEIEKNENID